MNEATRLANLSLEKNGYIVIAYRPWIDRMPSVGETLRSADNGEIQGPLRVSAQTDARDFLNQLEFWKCTDRLMAECLGPGVEYFRLVAE